MSDREQTADLAKATFKAGGEAMRYAVCTWLKAQANAEGRVRGDSPQKAAFIEAYNAVLKLPLQPGQIMADREQTTDKPQNFICVTKQHDVPLTANEIIHGTRNMDQKVLDLPVVAVFRYGDGLVKQFPVVEMAVPVQWDGKSAMQLVLEGDEVCK